MKTEKLHPLILFILGFGGFMFTRLSNVVPFIGIAIMIAPILILRFSRILPRKKAIWLTLLGFVLSLNIALWGLFRVEELWITIVFGAIRSTLLALVWFLPFMFDRILYPKFKDKGLWSTFVFPIATTAVFFLSSLEGPFDDGGGTLSSLGYGYGSLAFIQVRSIFGVWILIFIHSWFFAIVNYCWEQRFNMHCIKKITLAYTLVLLCVFVFGWIKIAAGSHKERESVKIAAVILLPEDGEVVPMSRIFDLRNKPPFQETISKIEQRTQEAIAGGAKIVSFQEYAMFVDRVDHEKMEAEFQRIAKENSIWLSIAYAYFSENEKGENKHLFINNKGEILLDYSKRYLMGMGNFGETAVFNKGPEIIQSADTPFGKIGISICRDMGFPGYMKQAGKSGVDIMLSPSYDWPQSSSPWYITSTIENGFSFVRPTYNGYSYAADYNGKVLQYMHADQSTDGIMYAEVPVEGKKVLYPLVGDLLGWLSLLALFILLVFTRFKRKR